MLASCCRLCRRDSGYHTSDFADDCQSNLVICVYDGDHKDDRCCSMQTATPNSLDIFSCGSMHDKDAMTPHEYAQSRTTNYIRWILFFAVIFIGATAVVSLLRPEYVVFNTLVDEVAAARLNEGQSLQEEAHRREQAIAAHVDDNLATLNAEVLTNFINKIFSSKDTTQEEKRVVKEMMEVAASKIESAHAEKTTIVAPMIIFGALALYYAIKCFMTMINTFELKEALAYDHILWCICNILGLIMATVGRGHGMQTSQLTMLLLGYYVVNVAAWVWIHQRIMYNTYTPRTMMQPQN